MDYLVDKVSCLYETQNRLHDKHVHRLSCSIIGAFRADDEKTRIRKRIAHKTVAAVSHFVPTVLMHIA